jgi:hypothetical protein|nr:MAG TPA: hypothetical protein [Caudoviricetes sp.]DAT13343.1 MAG TPA: hypothetical protein [Caudoviricetes sp.]
MEIVQVKQLSPGDRFALRNWVDSPQNRVVYRIPERPSDSVYAKRKTIEVICESGGGGKRIRKDEWVYKLKRGIIATRENEIR